VVSAQVAHRGVFPRCQATAGAGPRAGAPAPSGADAPRVGVPGLRGAATAQAPEPQAAPQCEPEQKSSAPPALAGQPSRDSAPGALDGGRAVGAGGGSRTLEATQDKACRPGVARTPWSSLSL